MDNPIVPPTGGFVNKENILSPEIFERFAQKYPKREAHFLRQAGKARQLLSDDPMGLFSFERTGENVRITDKG